MKHTKYILNKQGEPVIEGNLVTWAQWFGTVESRRVKVDDLPQGRVSTVFLGIDHNHSLKGPPILWETLVFGGKLSGKMDRCSGSHEQAVAMHERMVEKVKQL